MKHRARIGTASVLVCLFLLSTYNDWALTSVTAKVRAQEQKEEDRTYTAEQDTWVDQGQDSATHGGDEELVAAFRGSSGTRLLIGFDLQELSGAQITRAHLSLNLLGGSGVDPVDIAVAGATDPWDHALVTWTSQPLRTKTYAIQPLGTQSGVASWDVTGLLTDQLSAGRPVHGFTLSGPMVPPDYERRFAAVESQGGPTLVVSFIPPEETEQDGSEAPAGAALRWAVGGAAALVLVVFLTVRRRRTG